MKTNNKKCSSCNYCKQLYLKFGYSFSAIGVYLCTSHGVITEPKNSCENWEEKNICYNFSAQRFDEIEKDLKALKHLLKT